MVLTIQRQAPFVRHAREKCGGLRSPSSLGRRGGAVRVSRSEVRRAVKGFWATGLTSKFIPKVYLHVSVTGFIYEHNI